MTCAFPNGAACTHAQGCADAQSGQKLTLDCMKSTFVVKLPNYDFSNLALHRSLDATLLLTLRHTHGNSRSHAPARLCKPATQTAGGISTLLLAFRVSHAVESCEAGSPLEVLCCVSKRCSAWQAVPSGCRTSGVGCVLEGVCSCLLNFAYMCPVTTSDITMRRHRFCHDAGQRRVGPPAADRPHQLPGSARSIRCSSTQRLRNSA